MEKIFDKLGIYDLVAVLLSGICITSFSLLVDKIFYESYLENFIKIEDTILFLVVSYFMGLLFQELGSLLQKNVTHKGNKMLEDALQSKGKSYQFITKEEKDKIFSVIKKELDLNEDNYDVIYNYCKFYLISHGEVTRADKDQATAGMSRSLSLYFCVLAVILLLTIPATRDITQGMCAIALFAISVVLYFRSLRFAKMRYVYILRTFYYHNLRKQAKMKTD